ncbi:MAG TPA: rRNA large subunit methyltransferase I [Clostridiales bacterium]|nr:rRNA large subunit methyltransferase I [Clostridiales bacterium]
MYTLVLKKGEEKRADKHPWIFANTVQRIEGKDAQGSVAKVVTSSGRLVGYGFINHASKIIVRLMTRDETPIDRALFLSRVREAKVQREALGYSDNYRAVFSESDGLPGLIVDKYRDHLSVQILTLGMDLRRDMIVEVLREVFSRACIYERSDVASRLKEGLEERKGLLYGTLDPALTITENGLTLAIDLENGQKTGYFLDQKETRAAIVRYASGRRMLDLFCNQGGFSLNAAKGGAREVTAVDVSESALAQVEKNAALNGFSCIRTQKEDVFAYLREQKRAGEKYDLIVLDPPAFTKSADTVKEGYKGYLSVNAAALALLQKGGVMFTCSCSRFMTIPLFLKMVEEASALAKCEVKLLEVRTQAPDHAAKVSLDDALYLKTVVLMRV